MRFTADLESYYVEALMRNQVVAIGDRVSMVVKVMTRLVKIG